jgi:hypothetical protein
VISRRATAKPAADTPVVGEKRQMGAFGILTRAVDTTSALGVEV